MAVRRLLAAAWLAGIASAQALASPKLDECREFGMLEFSSAAGFKTIELKNNELLFEDRFDKFVGSQFVSTIIHGEGNLVLTSGASGIRFICMYGGADRGPIFFYIMPSG